MDREADLVTEVLAESFFYGDFADWLVADERWRRRGYRPYFRMLVDHALAYGTVEVTRDLQGVALWYAQDLYKQPPPEIPNYHRRLSDIFGDWVDGFRALDEAAVAHHPSGPSHDYLSHLAVHPDVQGRGFGSQLLAHHHERVDRLGRPCYLEATGERNASLYARHGYQRRSRFLLAPGSPSMIGMWRPPAANPQRRRPDPGA